MSCLGRRCLAWSAFLVVVAVAGITADFSLPMLVQRGGRFFDIARAMPLAAAFWPMIHSSRKRP